MSKTNFTQKQIENKISELRSIFERLKKEYTVPNVVFKEISDKDIIHY
jgi:hypothetical protein